ncbi:hypothetical protein FAI40_01735 [Acetobacteraceae bacterium]|nr:hypothetical protein FAI40_01735 [Acetobacteraceae bacterium]
MALRIEKILIGEGKKSSAENKQKYDPESDRCATIYLSLKFSPQNQDQMRRKLEKMNLRIQLPHFPQKYLESDYPDWPAEILKLLHQELSFFLPSKN